MGVVAVLVGAAGCFSYSTVPTTQPLVQQQAEFRVNDAGRVQLAGQLGSGTLTVEGRVVRQDESGWTLRVYRVANVRGESTTWTGEVVELPRASVELVSRKDFNRQRSLMAAATVAGSLTLFVLTRNLLGGGPTPGTDGTGGTGASIRF